ALAEVLAPERGQGLDLERALEEVAVGAVAGQGEADEIDDRHALWVDGDPGQGIAVPDLALLEDAEVEAGTAAGEEAGDHVLVAEADPQLDAGHPRLGDDRLGRADPEAVADV